MPIHLLPISRRHFIAGSAATIASLSLRQRGLAEESHTDQTTFAVLSDTHLMHPDSFDEAFKKDQAKEIEKFQKNTANLKSVINAIATSQQSFDGLMLNGDCVHGGIAIGYPLMTQLLGKLSEARLPLHFTLGNHDNRSTFLNAIPVKDETAGNSGLKNRCVSVVKTPLANWFLLDSLQETKVQGKIGEDQLRWLVRELDANADKPAFVMAHHNVNPSEGYNKRIGEKTTTIVRSVGKNIPLGNGLVDTDTFLDALLARQHVKMLFSGHIHQFRIHKIKHLHFVMLPSVAFPFQPEDAVGWIDCTIKNDGASLRMNSLDPTHEHAGKQVELKWS